MSFAKIFNTDETQILVKLDTDNDEYKPEVRFYFEPPELGVCSIALIFSDTDEGWDTAQKAFDQIDEQMATKAIKEPMSQAKELIK